MKPRAFVIAALIVALLASPLLSPAAPAADVPVTLIAFNVSWHLGTEAGAAQPNITATAGDVLRLRVENHDGFLHTFTVPHFSVSQNLAAGSSATPTVVFVNITTATADIGRWQFFCSVPGHTTGSDPNRGGMVGWIQVTGTGASVSLTLIAFTTAWHVASHDTPAKPTITVNPGDVLRLRIENHDAFAHAFTSDRFSVDAPLGAGSPANPTVVFVNITTSTADNGKWVFYCSIPGHTTGSGETRDGMVGWIQVGAVRPPPTPGFEVVLVIAALAAVAIAIRFVPRRKK